MEKVLAKLQEIIKGHLPEAVGKELQQYLKQTEHDSSMLSVARKENEELKDKLEEERSLVKSLLEEVKELKNQVIRKEELEARERSIDLEIAKLNYEHAIKQKEDILRLVDKVFGHPKVTVRETGTIPLIQQTGPGYEMVTGGTVNKETSREESKG